MRTPLLAVLLLAAPAAPALAQMDHSNHTGMAEARDGVRASATLNSVGDGTVNITHDPIPAIGWPTMTMDLPLIGEVDTSGVSEGDTVTIVLEKGADGLYGVSGIEPAE